LKEKRREKIERRRKKEDAYQAVYMVRASKHDRWRTPKEKTRT